MASRFNLTGLIARKEPADRLTLWVTKKGGQNPWRPGAFKSSNPLETLTEAFQEWCNTRKLGGGSKDSYATWGMFVALQDSVAQIAELQHALEEKDALLKDQVAQLEQREAHIIHLSDEMEDMRTERLSARVEKAHQLQTIQELESQLQATRQRAEVAEACILELEAELVKIKGAAQFLVENNVAKHAQVSHDACYREVEALKKRLGSQNALISVICPNGLPSLPSLVPSEPLPEEAVSSLPVSPDWVNLAPANPVQTESVQRTTQGDPVEQQEIRKTLAWKPHEVKVVADWLGPLDKDTGVQWLSVVYYQHTDATAEDLCRLARLCMSGSDLAVLNSAVASRGLNTLPRLEWIREVARILWPAQPLPGLFYMDRQKADEGADVYCSRKQFLGLLSGFVRVDGNGAPQYNTPEFKEAVLGGINNPTRIMMGPTNAAALNWGELEEKLRQIADIVRLTGPVPPPSGRKRQSSQEPVQTVTDAIFDPHLKPRKNRRSSSFRARKNPSGQSAESSLGIQAAAPPTPHGSPQQAVPSAQKQSQPPETSLRKCLWARLRKAGLDMAQFHKQPLDKLVLAYGRLSLNQAEFPQPPSPVQNRDKPQSGFSSNKFPQNNPKPNRDSVPQWQNKIRDRIFLWRELRNTGADMTQYDNQPTSVLMCAFVKAMRKRKTRKMLRYEPEMETRTRPTEISSESPKDWQKEIEKFKTLTQKQDLEIKDLDKKNKEFQGELLK
ncbi:uncharacterized protein LOC143843739 [Paroedura picta]|uniref:uncharacterized protein LOC143843739 n=1 Tax=Paroedura picta TaxID=143630 RepID=UPI0040569744